MRKLKQIWYNIKFYWLYYITKPKQGITESSININVVKEPGKINLIDLGIC